VDETGKVSNAKVVGKPLGYGLENEVLKAIDKMPTWTPGAIKGKNVKTYYTLPVNFKLEQ
jgi:protein TonB